MKDPTQHPFGDVFSPQKLPALTSNPERVLRLKD